jgi:hypothetical protein
MVLYPGKKKGSYHTQMSGRNLSFEDQLRADRSFARAATALRCGGGCRLVVGGDGCTLGTDSPWLARLGVLLEDGDSSTGGAPCPVALEAVDGPKSLARIGGVVEGEGFLGAGSLSLNEGCCDDPRIAASNGVESELDGFVRLNCAKLTCHDDCFLCL